MSGAQGGAAAATGTERPGGAAAGADGGNATAGGAGAAAAATGIAAATGGAAQAGGGAQAAGTEGTGAAAQPGSGGILGVGASPAGATPVPTPATWPADWRALAAGGDEAISKRLERFSDPKEMFRAYRELETRVSAGELKPAKPAPNAPAAELTAWRKANEVPDAPAGYLEKMPDGLVISDVDKPIVEKFIEGLHTENAPAPFVHAALREYYKLQEVVETERVQNDLRAQDAGTEELRGDWGNEFKANTNAITNLVRTWFPKEAEGLFEGRLADGTKVMNSPGILRGLLAIAKDLNPAATIVPAGGGSAAQSVDTRLAELTKMMGNYSSEYWKGPNAAKIQEEFRTLTAAAETLKSRAA